MDDNALLRDYAERGAEEAFAALVARHINKVYSVGLRQTGNPHQAEDITQAVFVILAKKARSMSRRVILSGWLYQTARLTAATFIRGEIRRARREKEAGMQNIHNEDKSDAWTQVAPLLDTAMASLSEKDRHAVVLRFFDGLSLKEVGKAFDASEDAAKMRVNRAVEKLRLFFTKRGVVVPAAILTTAILANSVKAAPAALAKSVTTAAIAKGATASASALTLTKGALKVMAWTQTKTVIVSAVVIGLAAVSILQHQAQVKLSEQNESLRRQMGWLQAENQRLAARSREPAPRLPAPQIQLAAARATNAEPVAGAGITNVYERLKDKDIKLTREQVESFLNANGRNAANLLAAFRTSGDKELLKEAEEKYPNDPQVDFEAVAYNALHGNDVSPGDQRKWLDAFEQSDPDNALANYLSAINYFNSGQVDQGVQDLAAASGKSLNDYTVSRVESDMEAYLAAGYPVADAQQMASSQLLLPQLSQVKQLALDISDLANAYQQTGDAASAQTVLQLADNLGQQYATPAPGEPLISQLVGIAIEKIALSAMDPNAPYGDSGQTVQDQMNQLMQQRQNIMQVNNQVNNFLPSLSDDDVIIYKNRWMMFGEANAQQWVLSKYGQ